jgi:Right handed beta helix region
MRFAFEAVHAGGGRGHPRRAGFIPAIRFWGFAAMLLMLVQWTAAGPSSAAEVVVSSREELREALQAAKGGEEIALAAGDYGLLSIDARKYGWAMYPRTVTIKAKDPENRPVFRGIDLRRVTNLAFSGIVVDYEFAPGDSGRLRIVNIKESKGVSLTGSLLDGALIYGTASPADGFATAIALAVDNSSDIAIENNEIRTWHRGAVFGAVDGLKVRGNKFHGMTSDGLDFVNVDNAVIEENHIHDFSIPAQSKAHPDMIQFWTKGSKSPSTNVLIRNNFLDAGAGNWTQSIFIRNEVVDSLGGGPEMRYRNFRIEGNVIRNGHLHGITVSDVDGLVVTRNTILQSMSGREGGKVFVPSINISKSATGVEITRNIMPRVSQSMKKPEPGWVIEGNITVQRDFPASEGYYGHVFANALARKTMTLADLAVLPDTALAKSGAGSPLTVFDSTPGKPAGFILNAMKTSTGWTQAFDASNLFGPGGRIDTEGATADWTFSDGGRATGLRVQHEFGGRGDYEAKVRIKLRNGQSLELARTISIGDAGDVPAK